MRKTSRYRGELKIVIPLVKSSELKKHDVAEVQRSVEPELEAELLQ